MNYEYLVIHPKAGSAIMAGQASTIGIITLLTNMTDMSKDERNAMMNTLDEKKVAIFLTLPHHEKKYDIKVTKVR